jgi:hypothetical protein
MTREEMKKGAWIAVLADNDTFTGIDGCWFAYTSVDQVDLLLDSDKMPSNNDIGPCAV